LTKIFFVGILFGLKTCMEENMKKTGWKFFIVFVVFAGLTVLNTEAADVIQLDLGESIQAEMPFILVLKNDDLLVTWSEGPHFNKSNTIMYSVYNSREHYWTTPRQAFPKAYSACFPQMVMDLDGVVHMAYMDGNASTNREIYYARYKEGKWTKQLAYNSAGVNSSWPRIQLENDKIYIIWTHNYQSSVGNTDVCMIVNDIDGTWPVPRAQRETISDTQWSASVHNSFGVHNGNIYCAWIDDNHREMSWNIYYNEGRYNSATESYTWGTARHLFPSDAKQYYPGLAVDDSGDVHLIYSNKTNPVWYARKSGNTWTAPKQISTAASSFNLIHYLIFKQGLLHTVWRQSIPSGNQGVFYGRGLPDGNWAKPVKIGEGEFPGYPTLDLDSKGDVHAVWSEGPSGDEDSPRRVMYTKIVLPGNPPEAVLNATPTQGLIPLSVQFDASASKDTDGRIVDYRWDFGDGVRATGRRVTHTYNQKGQYNVILTVIDDDMRVGTDRVEIVASSGEPFASFEASVIEGMIPLTVDFDASESEDVDGEIVSYYWDFGDGATGAGINVSHTYVGGGRFIVTLTVTDDDGRTGTETTEITVYQKPYAEFSADPTIGVPPLTVTFDASASYDADGDIDAYNWDFGDGITGEGETIAHTYGNAGRFMVVLTVVDNDYYTGTATQWVEVRDRPLTPVNVQVETLINKTLFFVDCINKVTWMMNPDRDLFNVVKYKIYRKKKDEADTQFVYVGEVDSSTFEYMDRGLAGEDDAKSYTYGVTAVDDQNRESDYAKCGS